MERGVPLFCDLLEPFGEYQPLSGFPDFLVSRFRMGRPGFPTLVSRVSPQLLRSSPCSDFVNLQLVGGCGSRVNHLLSKEEAVYHCTTKTRVNNIPFTNKNTFS